MITVFSTPKPFRGHSGMIQRNALESWKRLHPDVEVILFGDEEGAAEVCRELGLRHEAEMERSRLGAPRADFLFRRAQEIARHDLLCYSNCDIILTQDFRQALERLLPWRNSFLMVGCRCDTDITEPLDFSDPAWETRILARAHTEGFQRFYFNIDYFAFKRGLYREMPGLTVGRACWDHWMVWNALAQHAPVVDATQVVCAVHQNHDYSSHPQGMLGTWHDEDAQRNRELSGRPHAHHSRRHLSPHCHGNPPQPFSLAGSSETPGAPCCVRPCALSCGPGSGILFWTRRGLCAGHLVCASTCSTRYVGGMRRGVTGWINDRR